MGARPSVSSGSPVSGDWSVWLQTDGGASSSSLKSTLWGAVFVASLGGDVNVTVPPAVIVTSWSSGLLPATSWKALSRVVNAASVTGDASRAWAPQASVGTPMTAIAAHTNHGKNVFLIAPYSPSEAPGTDAKS